MGESGSSRQIELTPFRLRVGFVAVAVVIGLAVIAVISMGGYLSGKGGATSPNDTLAQQVQSLQEEVRKKELEIAIQGKRLKELQDSPTLAAAPPRPTKEVTPAEEGPQDRESPAENEGPLTALQDSVKSPINPPGRSKGQEEEIEESPSAFPSAESSTRKFAGQRTDRAASCGLWRIGHGPGADNQF